MRLGILGCSRVKRARQVHRQAFIVLRGCERDRRMQIAANGREFFALAESES